MAFTGTSNYSTTTTATTNENNTTPSHPAIVMGSTTDSSPTPDHSSTTVSSRLWSSLSSRSTTRQPQSSVSSSLFPDLQSADLYLPDYHDEDNHFDYINDRDLANDVISSLPSSTISTAHPCSSFNTSSLSSNLSSSSVSCLEDTQVQTKVYSVGDLWTENEIFARKLAPALTFIAFLMIIGFVGNALVVYVYGLRFKPATQHFLIVCLACFDLIMCSVAMPTEMADIRFHHTFDSVFACKLLRFVTMFASISSSLTLVTVAYDRHRRITRPLSKQMTLRKARLWTVANMTAALLFSWPTIVLTGIRTSQTRLAGLQGTDCSFSETYKKTKYPLAYNAVLGLGFFTLVIVIAVFYFRIWKTAKTRKINMAKRYTIGTLSEQSLSEFKLQTARVDPDGMNDLLSKQLEKCMRQDLYAKASIDCKDICYFLENNSIRTAVSCGIAKKRGKYKEFSISCPENNASSGNSIYSNSDECVLGQSFCYRKSVYANTKKISQSDDFEWTRKQKKSRKLTRGTPIRHTEVSSQKDACNDLKTTNSIKVGNFANVNDVFIDNSNIGTSDNSEIRQENPDKISEPKEDCSMWVFDRTNYMKRKYEQLMKPKCPDKSNSLTTLPQSGRHGSPTPSLKSVASSADTSVSVSPAVHRRNSSPLIPPKHKANVKTKVGYSVSIINEDIHLRPLSSLVDSVSQSLACLREFSDYQSSHHVPRNACSMSKSLRLGTDNPLENANQHCSFKNDYDATDTGVSTGGCVSLCHDATHSSSTQNTKQYVPALIQTTEIGNFEVFESLQENVFEKESSLHTVKTNINEESQNSDEKDYTKILTCEKDYFQIDPHENVFKSYSHLIGPGIQPMEIKSDVTSKACENHGYVDISNVDEADIGGSLSRSVSCRGVSGSTKPKPQHERVTRLKSDSDAHDFTVTASIKKGNSATKMSAGKSKLNFRRSTLSREDSGISHNSSTSCSNSGGNAPLGIHQKKTKTPGLQTPTLSTKRKRIQSSSGAYSEEEPPRSRCYSSSSLDTIPRRRAKRRTNWMCLSRNLDKTTVVAFTVSSVFVLSFLPFLILMFIRGFVKDFDYSLDGARLCIYHIFLRFYFLNSAINPFLYGLLNVNFRFECKRTWKKLFRCHGDDKGSTSRDTTTVN